MKREVIFSMPDSDEYRMVCRFGYSDFVNYLWWGHLQKKIYYKKWIFFGEKKWRWKEIDSCWWDKEIVTMDMLEYESLKFYDKKVLLKSKLIKQAMEL